MAKNHILIKQNTQISNKWFYIPYYISEMRTNNFLKFVWASNQKFCLICFKAVKKISDIQPYIEVEQQCVVFRLLRCLGLKLAVI